MEQLLRWHRLFSDRAAGIHQLRTDDCPGLMELEELGRDGKPAMGGNGSHAVLLRTNARGELFREIL